MSVDCRTAPNPTILTIARTLVLLPAFIALLGCYVASTEFNHLNNDVHPRRLMFILDLMFTAEYVSLAAGTSLLVYVGASPPLS